MKLETKNFRNVRNLHKFCRNRVALLAVEKPGRLFRYGLSPKFCNHVNEIVEVSAGVHFIGKINGTPQWSNACWKGRKGRQLPDRFDVRQFNRRGRPFLINPVNDVNFCRNSNLPGRSGEYQFLREMKKKPKRKWGKRIRENYDSE